MELLERSAFVEALRGFLREAAAGEGRLVFVRGEAGIGKTALVERFCREARPSARVAIASCDTLSTPGPLGPLIHIAPALGLPADLLLEPGVTRERLYQQILAALAAGPAILVGEDAHWSDEASLNFIRFLGRRIGELPALLIVTYRDDELGPRHPLRLVLGDLAAAPGIRRMTLPRLSLDAVRVLATDHDVDPDALYELTAGNPFFVTEVLAAGGTELPPSVRDAVLARAARLSPEGRSVLDAAAVIGMHAEPDLLDAVIGGPTEAWVEECLAVGVLQPAGDRLAFRHGLAWRTIRAALSPARRIALNRRALAMIEQDPRLRRNLTRLAHHAEEAGDRDAVLTYAVAAARQDGALRAHREAAAQYARALRFADHLPPDERAELLECRSYECYLTGLLDDAIAERQAALELRRVSGDRLKEGDGLRWLSRLHWFAGQNAEAERAGRAALAVLDGLPPGPELARAYSNQSQLRMLSRDTADAVAWGERAIALAERLGETEILAHALNNVGTAKLNVEDEDGRVLLERSLALARRHGYEDHVSRALTNLAWPALGNYRLSQAENLLTEGIVHTTEHDLDAMGAYLLAGRALLRLRRGDWSDALEEARAVERRSTATAVTRIVALTVLGLVQARRGEPPPAALDEALALAERTGELQRLGPVRAARAEAAWLAGDAARAAAEARAALADALRQRDRWLAGELALTLHRAGERNLPEDGLAEPFALQIRGGWQSAAVLWHELGCPLEEARALVAGDEAAVREAWATFDRLGARPDAAMASKRLRALGVRQIPRGPRPATRANPALLTPRELEILALIAEGKPNREIADRLFLSPRTVGHHVSTILGKLGVRTRADAARAAVGHDLLQDR
jgi:DNA-binding CsgD family transcriptional regulator